MRYFIDTEFIESGPLKPITLISIGIVAGDGREYYAVSSLFKDEDASDWVKANVLPCIGDVTRKTLKEIATDIVEFVNYPDGVSGVTVNKPEFWGYYADYDWVVF